MGVYYKTDKNTLLYKELFTEVTRWLFQVLEPQF